MELTKIELRGLKGQHRTVPLSPRTVLTGENGAGKTATLQGILVSLTGQDPALGKSATRNALAPQDGSPWGATLDATDGDGAKVRVLRDWGAGKRTGESARIVPGTKSKDTLATANAAILAKFGEQAGTVDLTKLLAMTPGQRASYLLDLVSTRDGHGVEELLSELEGCPEDLASRIRDVWSDAVPLTSNLDSVLAEIKDAVSEATALERETRTARLRLTEQRNSMDQEEDAAPMSAAEAREERDKHQAELEALSKELAANTERRKHWKDLKQRVLSTGEALGRAKERLEAAEAEDRPRAPEAQYPTPQRLAAAEQLLGEASAASKLASQQSAKAKAEYEALHERLQSLTGNECVHCGGPLESARASAEAELAATGATAKEAVTHASTASNAKSLAHDNLKELRAACQGHELAKAALEKLDNLRASVEKAQAHHIEALRKEQEFPGLMDTTDAERRIAFFRSEIERLDKIAAHAERARERDAQLLQADEDERSATEAATTARAVQAQAKSAAAELTANLLQPIVGRASDLLSGVNPDWAIEARSESGGIAFWARLSDGQVIPWSVLSGGESVVFGASLALALIRMKNPACRLLLLEAAEVDPSRLRALLTAISEMGEGFNNVIVATCHKPEPVEGWDVVDLGTTAMRTVEEGAMA